MSHTIDGPLRYGASVRFDTMPSSPIRLDRLEGVHKGMYSRELIDVTLPLVNGERLPSKAFIYVAGPDGWEEHFDCLPPYSQLNERGELDWRPESVRRPVIW